MRIAHRFNTKNTHEANGVTPIPAPISKTVSNFKKSSLALPNGPSTITRGRLVTLGWFVSVPTIIPPAGMSPISSLAPSAGKSQPTAFAKAFVKSPLTRM